MTYEMPLFTSEEIVIWFHTKLMLYSEFELYYEYEERYNIII